MRYKNAVYITLLLFISAILFVSCDINSTDDPDVTSNQSTQSPTSDNKADITSDSIDAESSDPVPEYDIVTEDGVTYAVYEDHAVILSAERSPIVVNGTVNGVDVTDIVDDALGGISDMPAEVSIYAAPDSFLYDFAVKKGYCFYGFYTEGEPVSYVPPSDKTVVERDASKEIEYTIPDDDEKITQLVEQYLTNGTGYDELIETIYYNYVCANEVLKHDGNMGSYYVVAYTNESGEVEYSDTAISDKTHTIVERYHKYCLYKKIKYGDITTYAEFEEYLKNHFSLEITNRILDWCINVNDHLYYYAEGGGGGIVDWNCREPEIEITVSKNAILLTTNRRIYTPVFGEDKDEFTGEYKMDHFLLINDNGRWKWSYFSDIYACLNEYESGTYILK